MSRNSEDKSVFACVFGNGNIDVYRDFFGHVDLYGGSLPECDNRYLHSLSLLHDRGGSGNSPDPFDQCPFIVVQGVISRYELLCHHRHP